MIESITIKKTASYGDPGVHINDLRKINFIYGTNGSGKTTISNLLANQDINQYKDCEVTWQHNQPLNSLVYNKNFRESNFGKGKIEGVFTLGQATKEETDLIEAKQADLKILKEEGIKKKVALEKQQGEKDDEEKRFKESSWVSIYKKYEHDFKEAFQGSMQKETFKNKLLKESVNDKSYLLELSEIKEKSKTIFGEIPETISFIEISTFARPPEIESSDLWGKKIIGKSDVDIALLIQKLNLNDWVNQGRTYLQDDSTCPFCQQSTITDEFKQKLEGYFDESFTESIKQIRQLTDEYKLLSNNLINELALIERNEKDNKLSKLDIDKFSAYLKTLLSQLEANKVMLENKNKEPSRSIDLISTKEQLKNIEDIIGDANKEIKKHNAIVDNYKTERAELIECVWKYLVEEFKQDINDYKKKAAGLLKGVESLENDVEDKRKAYVALNNEIKELTKNVTSVQPSVDEINRTLQYYGFFNFEIIPSELDENHYQIKREDGTLAESTLSEGEITFITFLYFLQLAKGSTKKEEISDERVLVVDDPISSLDSNVLFVVSTLLKGVIEDIKNDKGNINQLIMLTHNVYFHKEVSFINGRTKQCNKTFYWILRKKDKISSIQSYDMHNPIQTSYELLWQEIRDKDQNSGIAIQNTMRRIIENYFKILGKYGDDELIQKFPNKEEKEICRSLICWINDGSHSIADDLFIELQDDSIDKYLKVFEDIFVLTDHKGHYDMMMGIENLDK